MAPPIAKTPTMEELYPGFSFGGAEKTAAPVSQTPAAGAPVGAIPAIAQTRTATPATDDPGPSIASLYGPDFVPASPEGGEATQVLLGAAQGLVRDMPVVAGAVSGFRAGMPLAPISPLIPVATTFLGGVVGYMTGQSAEALFPAVPREDLIPYREGGKTFGSSMAVAPMAFGIPVMTANRVGRFVSAIGESARRSPKSFLMAEAASATGAGIGGGVAEAYDPGAAGTRFVGEVTGGLVLPGRLAVNAVTTARDAVTTLRSLVSKGGRETRAANRLYTILEENGSDIPALIKALQAPLLGGVPSPTSAQKTGDIGLTFLETALGQAHQKFAGESAEQGRASLRAYQLIMDKLKEVGDPSALKAAAKLRDTLFSSALEGRLATADANAALKIVNIPKDSSSSRRAIGEIVKFETELALRQARDYEKELWNSAVSELTKPTKVPVTQKVPMEGPEAQRIFDRTGTWPQVTIKSSVNKLPSLAPSSTVDAFLKRAAQIGDASYTDVVPPAVRNIMEAFGVNQTAVQRFKGHLVDEGFITTGNVPPAYLPKIKEVPVSELVNYRSNLLEMARNAAGKGETSSASLYASLADSILGDLSKLDAPSFDNARQFSRALNDTFTRTFAKTASITGDVTKAGAERLPAEILVQRAFGSNNDVAALRMEEIEGAVKFMRNQYDQAVAQFGKNSAQARALKPAADLADTSVVSVQDAMALGMRQAASKTIDPTTGRVDPRRLTKFVADNKEMLDRMGITPDLQDAATAENAFRLVTNQNSVLNTTLRNQTAFGKVLAAGERPSLAVADALNGRNPVRDIGRIVKLADAGGGPAVAGLKSSLYDYAYVKAGGNTKFDPQAFDEALFKPIAPNQPSLVNIMRANGLMTAAEVSNLRKIIEPMYKIQDVLANKRTLDSVLEGADAVTDLALRVAGAKLGTAASQTGGGGGASLIAASAGSKAVRQIFDKMPTMSTRNIIEQAAQDPQLMALLLKKGRTEADKFKIARSLHAYMATAGLNYADIDIEKMLREEAQAPSPSSSSSARQMLNQMSPAPRQAPVAPSTRGVPGITGQAPGPTGQAPGQGQGTAPSQSRAMFQQLFPFDTMAPMLGATQQQAAG